MIKAFLSHSSKDKERYVKFVAKHLGKESIHYDEFTFEEGEKPIDEIFKGINSTSLFVLFISEESLESKWVKEEVAIAKEKLDQDELKKIYPIIIDNRIKYDDERIPLWLTENYNLKQISKPAIAARRINQKLRELSWEKHPLLEKRQNIFVGRFDKLEEFEERIDDFDLEKPKCIFASGINSIGRRTLLKHALEKTNNISKSYQPHVIYLERNDSIEDFIIKVNDLGLIDIDDDFDNLTEKSIEEKEAIIIKQLTAAIDAKEIIFIVDNECLITYRKEVATWFRSIIEDKIDTNTTVICAASSYKINRLTAPSKNDFFFLDIHELTVKERQRLFKQLLELYKIDVDREQFNSFSDQLSGYPNQVLYAVDFIKEKTVHKAINEMYEISDFNSNQASMLLKSYEDDKYLDFIRLLAQFEFISKDFIFDIVDVKTYYPVLEDLVNKNICEYIGIEGEMVRLSDIVRDHIKRNRLIVKNEFKDAIKNHVQKFLEEDDKIGRDSSDYIFSIKEALSENKDIDENLLIPSHFLRCMKELYRERKSYDRVIDLADRLLQKERFIDKELVADVRYYLCQALARKKDDRLLKEVQNISGPEHNFLLGFYYRMVGRPDDAIKRLNKVVDERYIKSRARRELVQVFLQIEDYEKAKSFAKESYENNRSNQFHIQSYFNALINSDDCLSHWDTLQALCNELEDIGSEQSSEMSLIASAHFKDKIENNYNSAINTINDCISMHPDSHFPLLAKCDITIRNRDKSEIESTVKRLESLSNRKAISKRTISKQKAYLEASKGNLHEAKRLIDNELKNYPLENKNRIIRKLEQYADQCK